MLAPLARLVRSSFTIRFVGTFLLLGIVLSRIGWKLWAANGVVEHILWGLLFFVGYASALLLGGIAFAFPDERHPES